MEWSLLRVVSRPVYGIVEVQTWVVLEMRPTLGIFLTTGIPCWRSTSPGPSPESIMICGEPIAPADNRMAIRAFANAQLPLASKYSTPVATLFSMRILDTSARHRRLAFWRRKSRPKIGVSRTVPPAKALCGLDVHTVKVSTVEVFAKANSGVFSRFHEIDGERMQRPDIRYTQRPVAAAPFVGSALICLACLEERKHFIKRPSDVSEFSPAVIVTALAAHIHHGVDRARSPPTTLPRGQTSAFRSGLDRVLSGSASRIWDFRCHIDR